MRAARWEDIGTYLPYLSYQRKHESDHGWVLAFGGKYILCVSRSMHVSVLSALAELWKKPAVNAVGPRTTSQNVTFTMDGTHQTRLVVRPGKVGKSIGKVRSVICQQNWFVVRPYDGWSAVHTQTTRRWDDETHWGHSPRFLHVYP